MRIAIMGAGAIGMHLASQFFMKDIDVTLLCRTEEQMNEIKEKGICYEEYEGEIRQLFVPVRTDIKNQRPFDFVFITLKQTHMQDAIPRLSELSSLCRRFVLFQNGLGHEEFFRDHFPNSTLYLAVTTEGSLRLNRSSVRHTGRGTTWIGRADQQVCQKEDELLLNLMRSTSFQVEWEDYIYSRIWKKLLVNACINPLTAVLKVQNGQLTNSQITLNLMEDIFREGRAVAARVGVDVKEEFFQDIIEVCRTTYTNKSSMLQDVEAGRKTEIEYINGAIIRIANQFEMQTPTNYTVYRVLSAIEKFPVR